MTEGKVLETSIEEQPPAEYTARESAPETSDGPLATERKKQEAEVVIPGRTMPSPFS